MAEGVWVAWELHVRAFSTRGQLRRDGDFDAGLRTNAHLYGVQDGRFVDLDLDLMSIVAVAHFPGQRDRASAADRDLGGTDKPVAGKLLDKANHRVFLASPRCSKDSQ